MRVRIFEDRIVVRYVGKMAMLNRKTELGTQAAGLRLAFGQLGTTIRAVRALVEA